ncbi:MAG TPA: methyltransferase domain-containing protein [Candidatus Saccharimonadales bacterium]|nr:methyltransferase domain-containing protein [Candidatus Saccharimonadales bacterium]
MKTQKFDKKTKDFFDRKVYYGKGVDLSPDPKHFTPARKYEFDKFIKFFNLPKSAKLIELGSGYGRFVLPFLHLGYHVTAVDVSQNSLNIIKAEAKKYHLDKNLKTLRSDFQKTAFNSIYDAAFCISTFHLLGATEKKRVETLKNLVKTVKKGGQVLVIEPNPLNPLYYPFYFFSKEVSWNVEKHFMKSNEANLRKIFKNLGLKNIKVTYVGFLPMRFIENFPFVAQLNDILSKTPILNKFSSFIYIKGTC